MDEFIKIKCPNCNNVKIKGTLFQCDKNSNGYFRIKCKQCGAFIRIKLENGKVIDYEIESKEK